jgi:HK97 gp10 family phage protein
MKGFQVEVQGLSQLKKKLDNFDKNLSTGVDEELSVGAINIENKARQLAPHGKTGELGASIFSNVSRPFQKEVGSSLFYAPFVEFGTGVNVFKGPFEFTPEMRAFAREFFVSGKGILPAQPFLFPALIEEKPNIIKRIKEKVFKLK